MTDSALAERPLIGVSISNPDDLADTLLGPEHLRQAMIDVARALLRSGHALAYGGDLRPEGFTINLFELARAEFASRTLHAEDVDGRLLTNFLAWPYYLDLDVERKADIMQFCRTVTVPPAAAGIDGLDDAPREKATPQQIAACVARMRELMQEGDALDLDGHPMPELSGRVILGGKRSGYAGFMAGIIEEAARALLAEKPLFVIGAFGGAAGELARALRDGTPEGALTLTPPPATDPFVQWYAEHGQPDYIQRLYDIVLETIASPRRFELLRNGLSEDENRHLFERDNSVRLSSLITRGLGRVAGDDS